MRCLRKSLVVVLAATCLLLPFEGQASEKTETIVKTTPTPASNFSLEYGLLNNLAADGQTTQYSAIGFRYAYVFANDLALSKASFHDSLAAEVGAFYYSISGFQTMSDHASVVPVVGALRYSVLLGQYVSPFVYAGVLKNFSGNDLLGRTRAALGAGLMLNLGRNFAIRAEAGSDAFTAGAVVRL